MTMTRSIRTPALMVVRKRSMEPEPKPLNQLGRDIVTSRSGYLACSRANTRALRAVLSMSQVCAPSMSKSNRRIPISSMSFSIRLNVSSSVQTVSTYVPPVPPKEIISLPPAAMKLRASAVMAGSMGSSTQVPCVIANASSAEFSPEFWRAPMRVVPSQLWKYGAISADVAAWPALSAKAAVSNCSTGFSRKGKRVISFPVM